jgi:adenylate cyclase
MAAGDPRTIRKLSAIVVADVVHYSKQMEADEVGTLARLKALRAEVIDPALREHQGRLVKLMGDGLLAEFASAVDATEWAVEVQRAAAARNEDISEDKRMSLRIGVNVGDVILEDGDIYGEGVNVAARLEPLAPPGGVCISASVHNHVGGKIGAEFVSLGERVVKNIARPIEIWCWAPSGLDEGDSVPFRPRGAGRKPSLAVRRFEVMGTNPDAALLAEAAYDAAMGSLSNLTGITLLGDTARADFVASLTIQAVASRYRAVVRLSDNRSGEQFASDRFEGDLSDIFAAQDDLSFRVSQSIRFSVYDREAVAMDSTPASEHTDEMMLARVGFTLAGGGKRDEWAQAGPRLDAILKAKPNETSAWGMKACWHLDEVFNGWREVSDADRAASLHAAREAVRRNERSDWAHTALALSYLYAERDAARAAGEAERALELSPFYAIAHLALASAFVYGGRPAEGLEASRKSIGISTRLVSNHRTMQIAAIGALLTGRADEAVDWARRSDQQLHDMPPTLLLEAAACAAAGRTDEAHAARDRLLARFPDLRLSTLRRWPFRNPADLDRFMTLLAEAGLPR